VTDPGTGHVLPPLAQVALEEGETVARNLDAELEYRQSVTHLRGWDPVAR
jgi:NADH dehydrogenase FAD-containing subunit